MSPEAAAIILALLWGPTALWLIFRAVRGPTGGTRESFTREPARRRTEQLPLEAVIRNEYWICKDCRSVNHLGAMQCYACGIKRPPPEPVAPEPALTGNGWVAVMDPTVARRTTEPVPVTRLQPTTSARPPDPPVAVPMPEPAPEPAMAAAGAAASRATKRSRAPKRPRTPAGGATAAELSVAAHMTAAPPAAVAPAAIAPAAPEPAPPLAQLTPSITPPVCPYLGFKDDPATQCSYPDDRNVCHAAAAKAGSSIPSPLRLVRGGRRTLPISAEHQAMLCLTTEHRQCDRYPKAHLSAGSNAPH